MMGRPWGRTTCPHRADPVDSGEARLKRRIEATEQRRLPKPWPAVQEDQRRAGDALAADHHPLVKPAQPTISDLGDAAGHDLPVWPTERRSPPKTPHILASDRLGPSSLAPDPGVPTGSNVPIGPGKRPLDRRPQPSPLPTRLPSAQPDVRAISAGGSGPISRHRRHVNSCAVDTHHFARSRHLDPD